ncbi:unnamed protein product [Rhizophagus irregularis]|nr:unnamed protein product [Rhizophagus irregularis]
MKEKFVDGNKVTLDLRKYFQNYCGFIQKTTQLIEISIQEIYYIKSESVPGNFFKCIQESSVGRRSMWTISSLYHHLTNGVSQTIFKQN